MERLHEEHLKAQLRALLPAETTACFSELATEIQYGGVENKNDFVKNKQTKSHKVNSIIFEDRNLNLTAV